MSQLVECGVPSAESDILHIGLIMNQKGPKGGLKERRHPTVLDWLIEVSELTDAFLGHVQGKFAVIVLGWVLVKQITIRRSTGVQGKRGLTLS